MQPAPAGTWCSSRRLEASSSPGEVGGEDDVDVDAEDEDDAGDGDAQRRGRRAAWTGEAVVESRRSLTVTRAAGQDATSRARP